MHSIVAPSMRQGRGRTSHHGSPRCQACASFPCPTCSLSAFVGREAGSPCAFPHGWTSDDPTVRRPRTLCRLARLGDGWNLTAIASAFFPRTGLLLRVETRAPLFLVFLHGSSHFADVLAGQSTLSFSRPMEAPATSVRFPLLTCCLTSASGISTTSRNA